MQDSLLTGIQDKLIAQGVLHYKLPMKVEVELEKPIEMQNQDNVGYVCPDSTASIYNNYNTRSYYKAGPDKPQYGWTVRFQE